MKAGIMPSRSRNYSHGFFLLKNLCKIGCI
jgi:hypothetical protein